MQGWTIPAKSFDAVALAAATGTPAVLQNGASINLGEVMTEHACQVTATFLTTNDDGVEILLQGSLDGENWYMIASGGPSAQAASGGLHVAGSVAMLLTATDAAALFVRSVGYGSSYLPLVTTLISSR